MKLEKSCGAIIYRFYNNMLQFLIIQSVNGHFSFSKGHTENEESEAETALREIKEETNLDVRLDTDFREVITYQADEHTIKDVIFFVAEPISSELIPQKSELKTAEWLSFEEAVAALTFDNDKRILSNALQYIKLKHQNA